MDKLVTNLTPPFKVFVQSVGNERCNRLAGALIAILVGYGGINIASEVTGLCTKTISRGVTELNEDPDTISFDGRIRAPGGGRKPIEETQPGLEGALKTLVAPYTHGDPETKLRYVSRSSRVLSGELSKLGFKASHTSVQSLLNKFGFSLKGNQKVLEGKQDPLRNEQFEHINNQTKINLELGNPVISVDTKNKVVLGNFANKGKEWSPKGQPVKVLSHDFPSPLLDRAFPYGIFNIGKNLAYVNLGTTHDTPAFAVNSIHYWWDIVGSKQYQGANCIMITADCGGSNSYRARAWKSNLQLFSNDIGIPIMVCHFPPGTSKWNKIEHRVFSFISINWRGRPLLDYNTIARLIRATKTSTGLRIRCRLDRRNYKTGIKVSKKEFNNINIVHDDFQGAWNYTIFPH